MFLNGLVNDGNTKEVTFIIFINFRRIVTYFIFLLWQEDETVVVKRKVGYLTGFTFPNLGPT